MLKANNVNTISLQNILDRGVMMLILNLDFPFNPAIYHGFLTLIIISNNKRIFL